MLSAARCFRIRRLPPHLLVYGNGLLLGAAHGVLRLAADDASIAFGLASDAVLYRSAPGTLAFEGILVVTGKLFVAGGEVMPRGKVPALTGPDSYGPAALLGLQRYLAFVQAPFPATSRVEVVSYASGATTVSIAYSGGVFSPAQNRIYFAPQSQLGTQTYGWHFVDCNTGSVVSYASGATTVSNAYRGGVFSPAQNRIYFVPYSQLGTQTYGWHYVASALEPKVAQALLAGAMFNKL